jgi:hypothetical protein
MPREESPYPVGAPVTDPRLLQNRRAEIATALDSVAPLDGVDNRHAIVLGEQRSGRSTVLLEVSRQVMTERKRLVAWLRAGEDVRSQQHRLIRHVLTATVEALARAADADAAPWYLAWRDRVYLRDRSPSTARDLLSSALVLAADPDAEIDRAILERDMATLRSLAHEAGLGGIVLCLDDASSLTEDVTLVEEILSLADTVGGYSLLMAGLPATATHFGEAASPCLARFVTIRLHPFRGPHQVFTSLSAPLTGPAADWVRAEDATFLRDVLRLTGGNPYELMLVGQHLWRTCNSGEQERYDLTPRVLDRVIPDLALLASAGEALLDGAQAIDRLPDEQVRRAVELVALSNLTVRQIAIARILKIDSRDADRVDRAILTADVEQETYRVVAELEALQEAGVIQLRADRIAFNIVGGQPAAVLLKYKARARMGSDVSSQPFGLNYLAAVGRAVARDATLRVLETLEGASSLGFSMILSDDGAGRLSPRPAIRDISTSGRIGRLVQAEIDVVPWTASTYDRIAELMAADDLTVALVNTTITYQRQLEYTELWELPKDVSFEDLSHAWSSVAEEWQPIVASIDLNWRGSEYTVVSGEAARQVLIVVQRNAAVRALFKLFQHWQTDRDARSLARARQIGEEAVAAMRATGLSEEELGGELSGMLSRVGFLKSLDDSLLDEASALLECALRAGDADGWITSWNLANSQARQGDVPRATERFERVESELADWRGNATVLVFIPGRPAADCVLEVGDTGIMPLLRLQRAVLAATSNDGHALADAIGECRESGDPGAAQAADWALESLTVAG